MTRTLVRAGFTYVSLVPLLLIGASIAHGQATHRITDGFDFGGGSAANPANGWTFADSGATALTNFTFDWNSPDFFPGQPGWEGPPNAVHAGWAQITLDNAFASGFDVAGGEIATHGVTNAIYTPDATLGDPFTSQHSVNISGTLHNLRAANRSGPWTLMRNNTDILAFGIVNDDTLIFNNGPLSLATNATFVDNNQVTVSGDFLTGISYNPGDYFNLQMGNNDFVAVDLTVETLTAPGNGFGGPPVIKPQVAYYRFEEESGVDVIDSLSGMVQGQFVGAPAGGERSTLVPAAVIPQTGAANLRAADLRQGGHVLLTASEFIFNEANPKGADGSASPNGNATLEWYMNVPNDGSPDIAGPNGHTSIFWTNGIGGSDADRYNIFWDASFTGAPDSDRFVSGDFRSVGSASAAIPIDGSGHNNGNPLTEDEWHHIAIVRTDNTPGDPDDFDFSWDWYIDGVESATHHATTAAGLPAQDAFGWTIAGRGGGFVFNALIDEVRMTAAALTPSQFLNATAAVTPGDFDNDGDADGFDLLAWQRGESPNPLSAADFAAWQGNFGQAASAVNSLGVPEPVSGAMAICLAALLAGVRFRAVSLV